MKILITGATGHIGAALCDYLSEKKHDLILTSRTEEKLKLLHEKLKDRKSDIKYCMSDFSNLETFKELKGLLVDGIDGCVIMLPKINQQVDIFPAVDEWRSIFNSCFIGPLYLIQQILPFFRKKDKPAKVVIVSGISSVQIMPAYPINNVLRTAWLAEAKNLAFHFGKEKINFNTVSIGGVMTDEFNRKLQKEALERNVDYSDVLAERVSNVPLGKYASPDEIAKVIYGMLSDFSDHMTGVNILCDGGFTRAY